MNTLNLPSLATPLIGRDAELAQIRHWLIDPTHRLISLVGLGGVGKTRIAIEVASTNARQFPDGVLFVRMQPLEVPDMILPAIAEAARLVESPGVNLREQVAEFFRGKRKLLVLDSFENLLSGVHVISDLLQFAPEIKLLVTSREKLKVYDETVLHIGPLSYPEQDDCTDAEQYASVVLFLGLLRRIEPQSVISPEILADICHICRQLQGLPLAIRLAVGWADTLSLREISQEIARSIDFLETRMRDGADRHRNIRAVLEPSLQSLPDADRVVMEKLCIFRSSFTREAAEAVAGASLNTLALLVNKSLVRRRYLGGYEIHELVRQYGETRLNHTPDKRKALQNHYNVYYVGFLEARWQEMKTSERVKSIERIDNELANILSALQSMTETANTAQIWQSMNGLWGYFALRSRFNEGALVFGRMIESLRDTQDGALIGSLLLRQSLFLALLGRFDDEENAELLVKEGLAMLEHQQSSIPAEMLMVGYFCAAFVYWICDKIQLTKETALTGLQYAEKMQDDFGKQLNLCLLGRAEFRLGNAARAREIGLACYQLAVEQNDLWIQGITALEVLAEVAFVQKDYQTARHWCQTAQRCFVHQHDSWKLASTVLLTVCAVALKDFGEAQKQLVVGLRLLEENGMTIQIPPMMLRVARLLAEQEMTTTAIALLHVVIQHPACIKPTYNQAVLVLSQLEARQSGNDQAYIVNDSEITRLMHLIKLFTSAKTTIRQPASDSELSERELEVLRLIADGLSNAEIAQQLHLAIGTVKVHNRHIFAKLGVTSRTQAIAIAQNMGVL